MKLTKIEWKNVFSYGNELQTIEFDDGGALWQLCGLSGAGKTSIIQLPFLLLYGETINGVKLPGIPNRNNASGSMIRGYVSNGSNEYIITRTFKPHAIKLEKNGEVVDLPGIDSKQEYIRNEVMNGIPKNIYKNILTLSLNTDISFIDMGAKDKRSIVDFLLDMDVLNAYTEILKKDNSLVTQSINESNGSINVLDRNLNRAKMDLDTKSQILDTQEKIDVDETAIRESIKRIENEYKSVRQNYINKLNGEIGQLQQQKSQISAKRGECSANLSNYKTRLNLLMRGICPTCGSPLNTPKFDEERVSLREDVEKTANELQGCDNQIIMCDTSINGKYSEIKKFNDEIRMGDNKIQEGNNKLLSAEKYRNAKATYDSVKNDVSRLESERAEEMAKVGEKEKNVRLLGILKNIYSDSGVKKILREKYIPELNREINKSLEKLNIGYRMEFDNNFEAVLYDRGEKVQIETLSGGEKQRANIAVLYSLIKIVKNKYPQINIVALDETTSHIDPENGMDSFRFLKEVSKELNLNIIIVTHNEIIDDSIFSHRLFIEKKSGFSEITWK